MIQIPVINAVLSNGKTYFICHLKQKEQVETIMSMFGAEYERNVLCKKGEILEGDMLARDVMVRVWRKHGKK